MNENYPQPPIPDGAEDGILRGMHRIRAGSGADSVRLLGSGAILREALAAAELLLADFAIDAEVWSVTSFSELARNGNGVDRANRLHPSREPQLSYVEECLGSGGPPVIAATDYVRSVAEQIRPWVGAPYTTLGTDGFGRSDYRRALRRFFEVDRHHVAVAALHALGRLEDAERAIDMYKIDQEAAAPWTL
jgi:pyruvate dehydrogenase E1 component